MEADFDLNSCLKSCRPACDAVLFESVTTSQSRLAESADLTDFLQQMWPGADRRDFAMIDVFYTTLSVKTTTTFQSLSISRFIAELGGQAGIWLGSSVITLAHLVICLGQWLKRVIERRI